MPTQPPLAKGMRKAEGEKGGRKAQFDQIRPSILWCSSVLSSVLPPPPFPPLLLGERLQDLLGLFQEMK